MRFDFPNNLKDNLKAHAAVAAAGLTLMTGLASVAQSIDITTGTTGTGGGSATGGGHVTVAQDRADQPAMPFLAPVTPEAVPADEPAAPTVDSLAGSPQGDQQRFTPSAEQVRNVGHITKAAKDLGLSDRAAVIAVATSLQESKLENLGHLGERNDHDSQGLFQQRPSSGWGTVEQITDPDYSAKAFYKSLRQVDGWENMPLTEAAQTVQVSAFPDAYAQWESMAADLVLAVGYDTGPYAGIDNTDDDRDKSDHGTKGDKPGNGDHGNKGDKPGNGDHGNKGDKPGNGDKGGDGNLGDIADLGKK